MSDLNLIPQEFKIEKEKKTKNALYITLVIVAIVVLAVGAYIPTYLAALKAKENASVQKDIQKLSYVTEELNKLNTQKNSLQDRINVVDSFSKKEIKWTGVINDIGALLPSEITITNMSLSKDIISIQGTSLGQQAIASFVANIENSTKFDFDKINGITPDEKGKSFKFTLSFKLHVEESKVK
jgi:Tfp pilus assembly protein PilN